MNYRENGSIVFGTSVLYNVSHIKRVFSYSRIYINNVKGPFPLSVQSVQRHYLTLLRQYVTITAAIHPCRSTSLQFCRYLSLKTKTRHFSFPKYEKPLLDTTFSHLISVYFFKVMSLKLILMFHCCPIFPPTVFLTKSTFSPHAYPIYINGQFTGLQTQKRVSTYHRISDIFTRHTTASTRPSPERTN